MLILPPGHWQAISAPRQARPREKWIIGSVLGLLAAAGVALVISLVSAGHTSHNGCISVTAAYVTGGTELDRCGAEARALCASTSTAGAGLAVSNPSLARALATECRKAGLTATR